MLVIDLLVDLGYYEEGNFPKCSRQLVELNKLLDFESRVSEELDQIDGVLEMFLTHMA